MTITPIKKEITTGITITLNDDEVGSLIVALGDYLRLVKKHGNYQGGNGWPWIEMLKTRLDAVR